MVNQGARLVQIAFFFRSVCTSEVVARRRSMELRFICSLEGNPSEEEVKEAILKALRSGAGKKSSLCSSLRLSHLQVGAVFEMFWGKTF